MKYTKLPITITEQIEKLKQRGLNFGDEAKAAHYLSNISYYRLRAYTYPFQDNDKKGQPFNRNISFEEILKLYVFDRKLRLLLYNAIEKNRDFPENTDHLSICDCTWFVLAP